MANTPNSHGLRTDARGRPLLVQDSSLASNTFGFNGLHFLASPKPKFLFYVRFVRIGASNTSQSNLVPSVAQDLTSGQDTSKDIGFIVKSIERPKVTFDTETINQYNKKHVVHKKVDYKPVNIKFHDTIDNRVYKMFQSYFQHYFADSRSRASLDWSDNTISQNFPGKTIGWGLTGSTLSADLADYFSTIEIYQVYSGYYSQFNLMNPKLASFDPDELDFGASGVSHEVAMTIVYEGINYVTNGSPLSSNPSIVTMMGLDLSDFYEPESGPINDPGFNFNGSSNMFDDSNQFNFNNIISNTGRTTLSQIGQNVLSGQPLNIGGIFSGAFNSSVSSAFNQTANPLYNTIAQLNNSQGKNALGILGNNTFYNFLNSGSSNYNLHSNDSPGLRGLSLFGDSPDSGLGGLY